MIAGYRDLQAGGPEFKPCAGCRGVASSNPCTSSWLAFLTLLCWIKIIIILIFYFSHCMILLGLTSLYYTLLTLLRVNKGVVIVITPWLKGQRKYFHSLIQR